MNQILIDQIKNREAAIQIDGAEDIPNLCKVLKECFPSDPDTSEVFLNIYYRDWKDTIYLATKDDPKYKWMSIKSISLPLIHISQLKSHQ